MRERPRGQELGMASGHEAARGGVSPSNILQGTAPCSARTAVRRPAPGEPPREAGRAACPLQRAGHGAEHPAPPRGVPARGDAPTAGQQRVTAGGPAAACIHRPFCPHCFERCCLSKAEGRGTRAGAASPASQQRRSGLRLRLLSVLLLSPFSWRSVSLGYPCGDARVHTRRCSGPT